MAKVPFSKLQAVIDSGVTEVTTYNKNGDAITYEVKHYLPFADKLELVSNVINNSVDSNGYYNPMRVKLYTALETVYAYTNISFTENFTNIITFNKATQKATGDRLTKDNINVGHFLRLDEPKLFIDRIVSINENVEKYGIC